MSPIAPKQRIAWRGAKWGPTCIALLLLATQACRGSRTTEAPAPAPTRQALRPAGGDLARAAAFELVATSGGALLAWANGACSSGVQVQRLDVHGGLQASAPALRACAQGAPPSAEVRELTAAAGGGRLGLVWLVQDVAQAWVLGTHAPDDAAELADPVQLGAAEPQPSSAGRSSLWLAASDAGQMRVAWQAPRARCTGEAGSCAMLISEAHPPQLAAAQRRTDTREIPYPCTRLLVGSVWTQGVWYDAFCALDAPDGRALTQVYAIRPEIFYAEASPTLEDCEPLGVSPSRTGAIVWGQCADGVRAHLLAPDGRRQRFDAAERAVRCESERPVLEVRGRAGEVESYPLAAPRDRLELWLPSQIAPLGSRAVFTGRSLLVAFIESGHLRVHSHHCEGDRLVSDKPAIL